MNLDIELDSPVLVLPRSSSSPEVFVAHLGKIRISNEPQNVGQDSITNGYSLGYDECRKEHYDIEVLKHISMFRTRLV